MLEGKFKYWKKRNGFYYPINYCSAKLTAKKKTRNSIDDPEYTIAIESDVISNRNKVYCFTEAELGGLSKYKTMIKSSEMMYISSILKLWLREYWFHKSERFKQFKNDMKMKAVEERLNNIQNGPYARIFETLNLKIWNA